MKTALGNIAAKSFLGEVRSSMMPYIMLIYQTRINSMHMTEMLDFDNRSAGYLV